MDSCQAEKKRRSTLITKIYFHFKNLRHQVSQYVYELVKLDESEEEGEEGSEEDAVENLDRMSILDAISQCEAFRHTIRSTKL